MSSDLKLQSGVSASLDLDLQQFIRPDFFCEIYNSGNSVGDFLKGLNALMHIKTSYLFPEGHLFGVF